MSEYLATHLAPAGNVGRMSLSRYVAAKGFNGGTAERRCQLLA